MPIPTVLDVLDPLPHVTVHVVEPPWVRLEAVDGYRLPPILSFGSAALVRLGAAIIVGLRGHDRSPPPERRRRARARHVLALRLRQKAIGLAGLARQPARVRFGFVPIDVNHRS